MMPRTTKAFLLALLVAGCRKDQGFLEPQNATAVLANGSAGFGRVVTSVTLNGSAAPATITAGPNASLAFVVGGFTTLDQVITSWLSTSVTFTSTSNGAPITRCDDTDVWVPITLPGANLSVSFSALAPTVLDTYTVTVQAHQENACTAVFPSAPYPSGPDQLTLVVAPSHTAPVLGQIGDKSVDEGSTLAFTATASDGDVPPQALSFSLANPATGTFPPGATITSGGDFSWTPNEAQGPGTYRAKVVVSDGTLSDDEEIAITVNEVNTAPELTLPADIMTQWGFAVPDVSASATDSDTPANALAFAIVSGPSWVTISANGTISFGAIGAHDVGSHAVRIRVTDDGAPALFDEDELTLTVQARPTTLAYSGQASGQYSDKALFSATLTDAGVGPMNGTPVGNATIDFGVGGLSVGSALTNASGLASNALAVTSGAGSHALLAQFAGGLGYEPSSATGTFAVNREHGALSATFPGSGAVGTDLVVTVSVRELLLNGAEPTPNEGALPGDVGKVAAVAASLQGVNFGNEYQATCGAGSGGSASYAATQTFTCTFAGSSLTTPDVYTLVVSLPASDSYYQAASFEGLLSIWNPSGGSATGGGSFTLGGDRVTFAFNSRSSTSGARSQLVVVRHLANGGICRMKSSDQMNPGSVGTNNVTVSGKGDYVCHDPLGRVTASFSDVNIWLIAEDNGTPGAGVDRIWVANQAPVTNNMLDMPHPVSSNSVPLTGGNITVKAQ